MRFNILMGSAVVNIIEASRQFVEGYAARNGYTYEEAPLPATQEVIEPSEQEDNDAMLVDHEFRLTLLELGITE